MAKYAKLHDVLIPQSEPLDERQIPNNAGGYVYALDNWKRLDRFLILGSDSNTYYQKAHALTRENSGCVSRCYDEDYARTVARIVEISDSGRAPRNDAAIWALALGAAHKSVDARRAALGALNMVCRTSTHLFQFIANCKALKRGWGRAMKRAVANWYADKTTDSVAYQIIKYRSRVGYTHKRALELAHVPTQPVVAERRHLYRWAKGKQDIGQLPDQVQAHIQAMGIPSHKELIRLITDFRLPWEAIPTEVKTDPDVWKAMLPHLGMTAMIRNLGNMTRYGALGRKQVAYVIGQLEDTDVLRKARIHPFHLLQAAKVYGSGRGFRSDLSWDPDLRIVDALENAYYRAFSYLEPTGARVLIGLDVSGSMGMPFRDSPMSVAEAAAAMAMVFMRCEKDWKVMGFCHGISELPLRANMTLSEVLALTTDRTFGGTDAALPMIHAAQTNAEIDVFIVITDNETWAGHVHPAVALQRYRQLSNIDAKLVVMGMTSTGFSIADPEDAGMFDVVGMDSSVPELVTDFARG